MKPTATEIADAASRLAGAPADQVLRWAIDRFGRSLAIASSFSIEDCVVIDIAHKLDAAVRVFALDTGRLPEETYQTADRVRDKYGIEIEWQFPERAKVETLIRTKGLFSFMESLENRHECCGIRKVEPLGRVLAGLDAWVTGLRRDQSVTRSDTAEVELDAGHGGIGKLNPIIGWTDAQLTAYAEQQRVPDSPPAQARLPFDRLQLLHARGATGRTPARRPLVVGEPREQGMRPAPGQGHAARAQLTGRR